MYFFTRKTPNFSFLPRNTSGLYLAVFQVCKLRLLTKSLSFVSGQSLLTSRAQSTEILPLSHPVDGTRCFLLREEPPPCPDQGPETLVGKPQCPGFHRPAFSKLQTAKVVTEAREGLRQTCLSSCDSRETSVPAGTEGTSLGTTSSRHSFGMGS